MKKSDIEYGFQAELKRDIRTFHRLSPKEKAQFIFDYYRWKILAGIFVLAILISVSQIIWEGQKKYDLYVCTVTDRETDFSEWFDEFAAEESSATKKCKISLNQDQPFDYTSNNYQVYELEVLTKISANLMDVAICNKDMYSYLLAINACASLDTLLNDEYLEQLKNKRRLNYETANLQIQEDGSVDETQGIPGYYAIKVEKKDFSKHLPASEDSDTLYVVFIKNSCHTDQGIRLLKKITETCQ